MPIPEPLAAHLETEQFWVDYLRGGGTYADLRDVEVVVESVPGFRLTLSIDWDDLSRSLHVETPNMPREQLVHLDDAHPNPHGLRWSEVELICRAAAFADDRPFPGPLLLLLQPFVPLTVDDDVERVAVLVRVAGESLGCLDAAGTQRFVDAIDTRFPHFDVTVDGSGSLRMGWNHDKDRPTLALEANRDRELPAARAMDEYLAALQQSPLATVPELPTGVMPRPKHLFTLTVPMNDPANPRPVQLAKLLQDTVNRRGHGRDGSTCRATDWRGRGRRRAHAGRRLVAASDRRRSRHVDLPDDDSRK